MLPQFLETEEHIFLPVFDNAMDDKAIKRAEEIFSRQLCRSVAMKLRNRAVC